MNDDRAALEADLAELIQATGKLVRRVRLVSNERGLTWSQTTVLARLEALGPTTTADLARVEAVKPQSMGATLAGLEAEGLVERRPHATDGRQVLFALTADGLAARNERALAKRDWLVGAMGTLTQEERDGIVIATAIMRRLGDA